MLTQIEFPLKIQLQFDTRPLSPDQVRENVRVRCAGWNTDHAERCRLGKPVTKWEPHLLQEPVHTVHNGMCEDCAKWWRVNRETTPQPSRISHEITVGKLAFIVYKSASKMLKKSACHDR